MTTLATTMMVESSELKGKEAEKADYIALRDWRFQELKDQGKLKGFDPKDYHIINLVIKCYKKAQNSDGFFLFEGDLLASKISDKGFDKLKRIYEDNY